MEKQESREDWEDWNPTSLFLELCEAEDAEDPKESEEREEFDAEETEEVPHVCKQALKLMNGFAHTPKGLQFPLSQQTPDCRLVEEEDLEEALEEEESGQGLFWAEEEVLEAEDGGSTV